MSFPSYNERKPSGVDWLGPVPSHWSIQPLLSVARERFERNLGQREANLLSLSYGRIVRKDINSNEGLLPESFETYQIVHGGDLVWRLTDLQNDQRSLRTALAEETGIITSAYLATEPLAIDASYFSYLVRAYDLHKVFYSMGGGLRQSMRYGDVKRLPVLVPPFSEQRQIASFLDGETAKIDGLVAEQQRLIELLQEKRQAVISHAVTKGLDPAAQMKNSGVEWLGEVPEHWTTRTIAKASTKITNGYVGPTRDILVADGIPYIQATHVKGGRISFDGEYFVTSEWCADHAKSVLAKGDVLIVQTGAGTGEVGLVGSSEAGFNCHALIIVTSDQAVLLGQFLSMVLQSAYGRQKLASIQTGAMHPHLNCGDVKFVEVPIPPVHEQDQIVEHVRDAIGRLDALSAEVERAVKLLQERRAALISAAVTGKIDVRGVATAAAEAA